MKSTGFERYKRISLIFEIMIGVLLLVIIGKQTGLRYETNDDFIISGLLSGSLTGGEPQWWIFHIDHFLFTFPMMLLYRITDKVQWYGLWILFLHVMMFAVPVNAITSKLKNLKQYLILLAVMITLFFSGWYIHTNTQFTSTAEMIAISGFICYVFYKDRRLASLTFILFEISAFALRPEGMLVMIPIGVSFMLVIFADKEDRKKDFRTFILGVCIIAFIAIAGIISQKYIVPEAKAKEAMAENNARIYLFDYDNIPDYETVKPTLDENGISKEKYEAFTQYLILDWDNSEGTLVKIQDTIEKEDVKPGIFKTIPRVALTIYNYGMGKYSFLLLMSLGVVLLLIMAYRAFRYFTPVFCILFAQFVSVGYIVYNGRTPERVIIPLILSVAIFFICISLKIVTGEIQEEKTKTKHKVIKWMAVILSLFLFFAVSLRVAGSQYKEAKAVKDRDKTAEELYDFIKDYCNKHPENSYIVSYEYYLMKAGVLRTSERDNNFIFSGGWYSLLPDSLEHTKEYLNREGDVYFLVDPELRGDFREIKMRYLAEYFGKEPVLYEEIDTVNGGRCAVYRLK